MWKLAKADFNYNQSDWSVQSLYITSQPTIQYGSVYKLFSTRYIMLITYFLRDI